MSFKVSFSVLQSLIILYLQYILWYNLQSKKYDTYKQIRTNRLNVTFKL